jgi:hypothetical protein
MNTVSYYQVDRLRGVCTRITEAAYAHHRSMMEDPDLHAAYLGLILVRTEHPFSIEPGPLPTPQAC